jgi:hypothetical protein
MDVDPGMGGVLDPGPPDIAERNNLLAMAEAAQALETHRAPMQHDRISENSAHRGRLTHPAPPSAPQAPPPPSIVIHNNVLGGTNSSAGGAAGGGSDGFMAAQQLGGALHHQLLAQERRPQLQLQLQQQQPQMQLGAASNAELAAAMRAEGTRIASSLARIEAAQSQALTLPPSDEGAQQQGAMVPAQRQSGASDQGMALALNDPQPAIRPNMVAGLPQEQWRRELALSAHMRRLQGRQEAPGNTGMLAIANGNDMATDDDEL